MPVNLRQHVNYFVKRSRFDLACAHSLRTNMLLTTKDLDSYGISATDGEIGQILDFYFDDATWVIRYLVVDTGTWLPGRKVLISPIAITKSCSEEKLLMLSITKELVKNSPDVDVDKPVSQQHEITHLNDPHLRSCNEVKSYLIQATDGEIGHVSDILIDQETWAIRYMVVDTSTWWLGHQVIIAPQWIQDVSWSSNTVTVGHTRQEIKDAPIFSSAAKMNRKDEENIYTYYRRTGYWGAGKRSAKDTKAV
jgi:uncharacterized protein YrrD